jgi:hypothetical protein
VKRNADVARRFIGVDRTYTCQLNRRDIIRVLRDTSRNNLHFEEISAFDGRNDRSDIDL